MCDIRDHAKFIFIWREKGYRTHTFFELRKNGAQSFLLPLRQGTHF